MPITIAVVLLIFGECTTIITSMHFASRTHKMQLENDGRRFHGAIFRVRLAFLAICFCTVLRVIGSFIWRTFSFKLLIRTCSVVKRELCSLRPHINKTIQILPFGMLIVNREKPCKKEMDGCALNMNETICHSKCTRDGNYKSNTFHAEYYMLSGFATIKSSL